jgi:hypothetical protein
MLDMFIKNLQSVNEAQEAYYVSILLTMLVAMFCGIVIYMVYRLFYRGVLYSENFNILIMLVCLVTAFAISAIHTNLLLMLGMVGTLSIIRFRASIKDPLDVGFLFWSVATGLSAGAGLYGIAIVCTIFISLFFLIMSFIKIEKKRFLLIIKYKADDETEKAVNAELKTFRYKLKNKTIANGTTEITADINIKKNDGSAVNAFGAMAGVESCVLLEYTSDYSY